MDQNLTLDVVIVIAVVLLAVLIFGRRLRRSLSHTAGPLKGDARGDVLDGRDIRAGNEDTSFWKDEPDQHS